MIQQIANLYEVQFPIYISEPIKFQIVDITIDNGIKNLVLVSGKKIPYDIILNGFESTYLGRLMMLERMGLENVITFDYSFTNIAHLIYARPKFNKDLLIVDNLGQVRAINEVTGAGLCKKYAHKKGNYIFCKSIPSPLQIPQFPLLLDSLETYEPYLELVCYYNTYYFKNILAKGVNPKKTWTVRLM